MMEVSIESTECWISKKDGRKLIFYTKDYNMEESCFGICIKKDAFDFDIEKYLTDQVIDKLCDIDSRRFIVSSIVDAFILFGNKKLIHDYCNRPYRYI